MKKELKVRTFDIDFGKKEAVLHTEAAGDLGVRSGSRVKIISSKGSVTAIVNTSNKFVREDEIAIFDRIIKELKLKDKEKIYVQAVERPESVSFIKRKLRGQKLSAVEIRKIIDDIVSESMSEIEISSFVSGLYINGMDLDEIEALTKAMAETGSSLDIEGPVFDKHSVVYETPVLIREKGEIKLVLIGEFVDGLIRKNGAGYVKVDGEYEVVTFDDNLKVSFKPLTGVYRHPAPEKLYEVTLTGNRKVVVTDCHSLFALRNGEIKSVPTKEIRIGDFIAVPRKKIKLQSKVKEIDLLRELLRLPNNELNGIYVSGVSGQFKGKIPYEKRVYDLVPLKLLKEHDVTIPNNAKLKVKKGNKIPIKIKVNKELIRLLGYYVSEGYRSKLGVFFSFGAHEKELISDTIYCIRKTFGLNPTINYPHKTAVHVCIYNQLLSKIFKLLFRCGDGALKKKIPQLIFNVSNELQMEFLRAYFKGDGYVRRGYEGIFVTSSKDLALQLPYLLSMNGISFSLSQKEDGTREFLNGISKISKSYFIYFQARALEDENFDNNSFLNLIPIKEGGLRELCKSVEDYKLYERSKRQKFMRFEAAERILEMTKASCDGGTSRLIRGNLAVLRVKEIREISSEHKYVYDLCVEGYEKFLGGIGPIFLHNSIGGVSGNKITPLIVPIVASAGLKIPKTSSRAITSPSGTADIIEIFCPVDLNLEQIKRVVEKTNGCMVWGGAVDLAPADDLMIHIEFPLDLDPRPLLLASVMSKKKAVNADYVVIDIPVGRGTKVENIKEGEKLARDFIELGSRLGIEIECALTYGGQPVGYAIGPALEAREALSTLKYGKGPHSLMEKACGLAGILLEIGGIAPRGSGQEKAEEILKSGEAYDKFKEIVKAQGGDPKVKPEKIKIGKFSVCVRAKEEGYVSQINNSAIKQVARAAGAPKDKGAGILLAKKVGKKVEKGQELYTIYAENSEKLKHSEKLARILEPVRVGGMVLEKIEPTTHVHVRV